MKKLSEQLQQFISPDLRRRKGLSRSEKAIFRALKLMGERATKGREISRCLYETRFRGDKTLFVMLVEGRHAASVGRHVGNRFEGHDELEFVDVHETKKGVKVVLGPKAGDRHE